MVQTSVTASVACKNQRRSECSNLTSLLSSLAKNENDTPQLLSTPNSSKKADKSNFRPSDINNKEAQQNEGKPHPVKHKMFQLQQNSKN